VIITEATTKILSATYREIITMKNYKNIYHIENI